MLLILFKRGYARYTSKMMRNIVPLLIASASILASNVVCAELADDSSDLVGGFTESKPWQESEVAFPAYPAADDMMKVEVDRVDMPFNFYIDAKNLAILKEGGVVRYTVVIQSVDGSKNVLFEGIRCRTKQFRTYAYGTYDKKFSKASSSQWKDIEQNEFMVHRENFFNYYMCDKRNGLYSVREMLRRIEYPTNFLDSGDLGD